MRIDWYDVFSKEEIYTLWQTINIKWYYDVNSQEAKESANYLLRNIMDCADSAITHGHLSADLRTGFDSYISLLLALMGVNELDRKTDLENIHTV